MDGTGVALSLARRMVAAALMSWPAEIRRRDGAALRSTVDGAMEDAARSGTVALIRCAIGEAAALAWEGVGMRVRGRTPAGARARRGSSGAAEGWAQDVRTGARALVRTPTFTVLATCALALGIGANAAMYDLVDRVLLQPPPYAHPDDLILVWRTLGASRDHLPVPAPDADALASGASTLADVAFQGRSTDATLSPEESATPEHVVMAGVTPDFFQTLGVAPEMGRGFMDDDAANATGATGVSVLISDGVWRRVFAADPDLPGRAVLLNARPVTVLGVIPPGFRLELPPSAGLGDEPEVWVPIRVPLSAFTRQGGRLVDQDSDNSGVVVARLSPGATLAGADQDAHRVGESLRREVPGYQTAGFGLTARPLHADATAHARPLLLFLLAGAAGLLLVACLSVSALLLARGMAREREMVVRVALGAGRWRIARLLLTENALLLFLGGVLSVLVAMGATEALIRLTPPDVAHLVGARPGLPLSVVAVCLLGIAALFGAIALLQAHLQTRRSDAGRLPSRFGRARAREALVVGEVAVSVVLVLGAGLLLRTAGELRHVDPGFRPDSALVFDASVRVAGRYRGPADRALLVRDLERAALELPDVRAIGLTGALPLSGRRWTQRWGLAGEPPEAWQGRPADFRSVTSGYFEAMGMRMMEGRVFTAEEDLSEGRRVVVVDEPLARALAPAGSAVGASIEIPLDGKAVTARIVGVVGAVRHDGLDTPSQGAIYVPYRQEASRDIAFVVRTDGSPSAVVPALRRALLAVEPGLALYGMRPMTEYVDAQIAPTRFGLTLLSAYAALGLLASALGLYGVIAWEVQRHTRDLGVRKAVGATARQVRGTVLARGARLGALGLMAGAALAAAASGGLSRLVYGIGVTDPVTWAGVVATVTTLTLLASWVPAARAARLDPSAALRSE